MDNKHLVLLWEEKLELISVSVAIELAIDSVGVAGDDCMKVRTPNPHTIHMARRDVTQYVNLQAGSLNENYKKVNLFTLQLCQLKLKDEP